MAKFIPIDKMQKLREASRNGDEKAKAILMAQMNGEDFDLDGYFAPNPSQPQVEEAPTGATSTDGEDKGLMEFLEFNGITKESPDYQSYVDDYYKENPKPVENNGLGEETHEECEHCVFDNLIADEIEAIENYNSVIMEVMNNEEMSDSERKGVIASLEEIKRDEVDHLDKLRRMKADSNKKEEKIEGTVE